MGNTVFGERITKLRKNRQLSMGQLAEELGIGKSRISMWENNGVVPKREMLIKLSDYFQVSIDYLLGNEENQNKQPESSQTLRVLQRKLQDMDEDKLMRAKRVLESVFDDIFEDEEE